MPFPPSHPSLDSALAARGYAEPTEVQAACLDPETKGRDLLVSAQTGSGKTVAFGLAAAETLLGDAPKFDRADAPLALVIAPTRELALQVNSELTWLYADTDARIVSCVGGMDARKEARALNAGAHIVVGTPGRLRDHIERGYLDLSALRVVVLDEADEMLDMGFKEDLEFILQTTPPERRTLLFSATIARDIATLARSYQRDALRIDTTTRNAPHGDIEYRAMRIAPTDMEHAVVNVLRYFEAPGAIVFCNTREAVKHLHASLRERGFSVVGLSGELSQRERSDALQALRDGHARVCVATDVAARGLDLPDLGLVIHAQLPVNKAGLLHRSGRTGRAGKKGVSVLLVSYTRRRKMEQMLASANIEAVWSGPPAADEIRARDHDRLLDNLTTEEVFTEDELTLARQLLERRSAEQLAAALIRSRRSGMPDPEEVYDDERMKRDQATTPREAFVDFARDSDCEWFKLNVGRDKNADPKWLLPLICRLGHVTKRDIGSIKIFDRETKFEITKAALDRFKGAVAGMTEVDMKIEPTVAPAAKDRTSPPRGPKPPFKPRDNAEAKPRWADRGPRPDGDARPAFKKPYSPRPDANRAEGGDKPWAKKPYQARDAAPADGAKPWEKRGPKPERSRDNAASPSKPWEARGPRPEGDKPFKRKTRTADKGKPKYKGKTPNAPR